MDAQEKEIRAYKIVGTYIYPLVSDQLYLEGMAKISILKKEKINKKFPMSVALMSR